MGQELLSTLTLNLLWMHTEFRRLKGLSSEALEAETPREASLQEDSRSLSLEPDSSGPR